VSLHRPRAFWIATCNLVGLLFSLVGVVLLFLYALPIELPLAPNPFGAGPVPGADAQRATYYWLSHIGLLLVLCGTIMEAVPPLCTAIGCARRRQPPSSPQDSQ
jgi:hypothetical protein